MKDIGARIREARLAKNLKQEDLATLVGVKSLAAVSSWERGVAKPDCMVLKKICEILDVSPDQLLGYNGDTPTATEWNTIKKYRTLDEYGKKAVNGILDIEYERALAARANKQKARMLKLDYYSLPVSAGTGNFWIPKSRRRYMSKIRRKPRKQTLSSLSAATAWSRPIMMETKCL